MVKKIIFSGIFLCMLIAIPLALLGYKEVELGTPFLALLKSINKDLADFTIAIPDIPNIPHIPNEAGGGSDILSVLINLANGLIGFVNTIINIINILVQVINIVIQLIQVIVLFLKHLINFKDTIANYNSMSII